MTARAHPSPSTLRVLLLVALLSLIWGSTWLVIREGLEDLPPFSSAAMRFLFAALLMAGVARLLAAREGGADPPLRLVLVMGFLNFATSYGVVYWAERVLPSALASVLWAVYPIIQGILSHLALPGEGLRLSQGAGFLLGFAGVVLLFVTDIQSVGPGATTAGLVLLISPAVVAVATTYIKRCGAGVSSLKLNRDGMILGAALLTALALCTERDAELRWTGQAVFSVAYLSVVGTVVTFSIFFWLLRYAPAYQLAVIPYVTPAVALLLGFFVAGEPLGPATLAGMGLILGGVVLVTGWRPKRAASRA
ncbi:MAG: EamA family transporter [Planctomycetes bacterium]|nr:EamA family transporter [Planctomycetota bacterium]